MLKTVALFAGCGGLDLGFKNAGFNKQAQEATFPGFYKIEKV